MYESSRSKYMNYKEWVFILQEINTQCKDSGCIITARIVLEVLAMLTAPTLIFYIQIFHFEFRAVSNK